MEKRMSKDAGGAGEVRRLVGSMAGASLALALSLTTACSSMPSDGAERPSLGGGGSGVGGGASNTGGDGTVASGGSAGTGTGGSSTDGGCVPAESALPAIFASTCGSCHSAFGMPAGSVVPDLFKYADTVEAFTAKVRSG